MLLLEQFDVFDHPPLGLVETVFDGRPDSRESFEFSRIEKKLGSSVASIVSEKLKSIIAS